jgi:ribose transport system ATP-binding protein
MAATAQTAAALQVSGIQKVYGGEVALAGASLRVGRGEIHGLLGANGAGKSTLVRIICGAEPQDAGTVAIGGEQLPVPHSGALVKSLGCALIHQDRALAADLTIAENVALTVGYPRRHGLIDRRATARQAREALDRVGLRADVQTYVGELPIAEQTLVAIARALAVDAQLILLDEPTANLGQEDAQLLYGRLRTLAAGGVACVLITHALGEALEICDHVTVLRNGAVVATRPSAELTPDELATLVVGHTPVNSSSMRSAGVGDTASAGSPPRLRLRELRHERIGPLTLDVQPGEIVGITGLADSGHLLIGDVLAGLSSPQSGEMELDGDGYRPRGVRDARLRRVAYVPPDRVRDGLATDMTARENLFLDGGVRFGTSVGREREQARDILTAAKVRPPDPDAQLTTLSGGNMQKVLLAKWLTTDPTLLVLTEPTVGVDIGAREDIYARLREACAGGLAVLLASSDLEEVAALSDRVIVLRYGRVVAELTCSEATTERLAALSS